MKQFIISGIILFSLVSFSQENKNFSGHWSSDDSSYYLTINEENFITYRFAPKDEEGYLSWDRVYSPGKEVFVKKEDNVIVTNYWIDEQEYYVKVHYTLIDDNNMKAEFNGKYKGESYYNVINYKKIQIK